MNKLKLARIKLFRGIAIIVVFFILLNLSASRGMGAFFLSLFAFVVSIIIGIMYTIRDAKKYIDFRADRKFNRNFDNALARFHSPDSTANTPSLPDNRNKLIIWDETTDHLFNSITDYLNYKRQTIRISAKIGCFKTAPAIHEMLERQLNEANILMVWYDKDMIAFNGSHPIRTTDILEVKVESQAVSIQRGNAYTNTYHNWSAKSRKQYFSYYNYKTTLAGRSGAVTTCERDNITTVYHVMVTTRNIYQPLHDLNFYTSNHNAYEVYSLLMALKTNKPSK